MSTRHYIKINKINGDSVAVAYKGFIEVLAWEWGSASVGSRPNGSAKPVMKQLVIQVNQSIASADLLRLLHSGRAVEFSLRTSLPAGNKPVEIMTIEASDCRIVDYAVSSADNLPITESWSLDLGPMKLTVRKIAQDGSVAGTASTSYNPKTAVVT